MIFDFSGYSLFQDYLQGKVGAEEVLAHPAYRAIQAHATQFGDGLSAQDIEDAAQGRPSPFFGLKNLQANQARMKDLVAALRTCQEDWLALARSTLARLLPEEDLSTITIYPVIGYDMGIGLRDAVCMNVNHVPYQQQPEEFLYYLIHECVHVVYERYHKVAALEQVRTAQEWQDYFALFLQNEGYAVYTPWDLRRARGHLADADYRALEDGAQMARLGTDFRAVWLALGAASDWTREQYLEQAFGDQRLTYRVGSFLIRRIEMQYGMEAVRRAFYLGGREFVEKYADLL
ncbi:MAG TPA: hypothetical protein VFF78_00450 [Anaerolineaceae bacterium]|nr:hypothetical protein [Anaerolineaceae bacterium]